MLAFFFGVLFGIVGNGVACSVSLLNMEGFPTAINHR